MAGRNAAALVLGQPPRVPPRTTALGALALLRLARQSASLSADEHHVRDHGADRRSIVPADARADGRKMSRKETRKFALSERALADLERWIDAGETVSSPRGPGR